MVKTEDIKHREGLIDETCEIVNLIPFAELIKRALRRGAPSNVFDRPVELLSNAEFNQLIKWGRYRAIDVVTRKEFTLCFAGSRNDHYDVTPATEYDARVMESIIGQRYLLFWRNARPTVIDAGGRLVAFGLCYFMHHIRIGEGNPGPDYPSITTEKAPPWTRGGHCCGYVSTSVGGGGNAPNPACSDASNAFARRLHNGGQGGQARAACYEAYILGNVLYEEWLEMNLLSEVRKFRGCEKATISDIAKIIGYQLQNSRVPAGKVEKEFEEAVKAGVSDGVDPGMPAARWQVALMAYRVIRLVIDTMKKVQ